LAFIEQIPRQAGNPFIFCGRKPGKHLVNVAKAWARIRSRGGCEDVWIHDLRRTVGSWLATSGVPLNLIGAVLNHADSETTAVYARLADDSTRSVLEEHGDRLMRVAQGGMKADPVRDQLRKLLEAADSDPADLAEALRALAEDIDAGA
jgi:hypothetical protein